MCSSVALRMFTLLFNHHQQASPESSPTARPWPSPFHLLPLWLGYSRDFMSEWFAQSCLTLWNPMDWSLPGSSVHGILQARLLDWVAISFSRNKLINLCESHPVVSNFLCLPFTSNIFGSESESHSVVSYSWICVTPWTIQSMEFSRPEYWTG